MTLATKTRKPFQVVVKNDPLPVGSRKQLMEHLAKTQGMVDRGKIMHNAKYPGRLKGVDE
jgi:hypothetical protein